MMILDNMTAQPLVRNKKVVEQYNVTSILKCL